MSVTAARRNAIVRFAAAAAALIERGSAREDVNIRAERLLNAHGNSVLRCAYSYLCNMADAEDVLQDTFVQLLKANPRLESAEHERAWLLHVAANLCKNRLKYSAARRMDELSDTLAEEGREDLSFVWDAVRSLPSSCRECVHLFYFEGMSTAQIADILGRSESAVRSALHRGRERLRVILREDYDFEIR